MAFVLKTVSTLTLEEQQLESNIVISLVQMVSIIIGMQLVSHLVTFLSNMDLTEVLKLVVILVRPTNICIGMALVKRNVLIHMLEDSKLTEITVMSLVLKIPIISTIILVERIVALLLSQTLQALDGLATCLATLPQCYIGITLALIARFLSCLPKAMTSNTVIILVLMAHISTGTPPALLSALILLLRAQ